MNPVTDSLLDELAALLSKEPVDEHAVCLRLLTLTQQHLDVNQISVRIGIAKERLLCMLSAHAPELATYRMMCGESAAAVAALLKLPQSKRKRLRMHFEATGRPYTEEDLCKQTGHNARATSKKKQSDLMENDTADGDATFLQSLVAAVERGDRERLAPLGQLTSTFPPSTVRFPQIRPEVTDTGEAVLDIRVDETHARKLIQRLGGDSTVPTLLLHAELHRVLNQP